MKGNTFTSSTSLVFSFCMATALATAQPKNVDSLVQALNKGKIAPTSQVDTLLQIAKSLRLSSPEQALIYAQSAQKISDDIGYSIGRANSNALIGILYWLKSLPDIALHYAQTALNESDSIHYAMGQMEANLLLGSIYKDLRDFGQARTYTMKALEIGKDINNLEGIVRAYNSLGKYCLLQKDHEEASMYFERGLSYLKENHADYLKTILLCNYAQNEIASNNISQKSKQYLDEALEISIQTNNKSGELQARIILGEFHKRAQEYEEAENQLTIAEKIALEIGYPGALLDVYKNMIDVKSRNREVEAYRVRYSELTDSIFQAEIAKRVAELEAVFETEKKNHTIERYQHEQERQMLWAGVLVGGVLMVVVGAVLLYIIQKMKVQKATKLLELQTNFNEKLTEIDKLKSNFFTNISHEFRTPLTLILAPLENELSQRTDERENLSLARRNAVRLLELVNQLLDLSKLELGKMDLRVRFCNLQQLLVVITSSYDSLAEYKQIQFSKTISLGSSHFWIDPDKIEKIISSLLSNAFKFTPAGGTVKLTALCNSPDELTLSISDSGRGIPLDEQDNVFSSFYQAKNANDQQISSGIGLALARDLIELYGGEISTQSSPDSGTTFNVRLPLGKEAFLPHQVNQDSDEVEFTISGNGHSLIMESYTYKTEAININKDTILIVEDNADLREYISGIFQSNNFGVIAAGDGREALSLAVKHVPSLILSDLMMPNMDGIEMAQRIKGDERTSHIPVVLLTAKSEAEAKIEGLKTGADDFIIKPFSSEELLVRIQNLIEQRKKLASKFRERILIEPTSTEEVPLDDRFLQKVREAVEANLGDYMFTVEKLAAEMNLSRTQLLRKLKALTGLSPNDFIKDMRLKRAEEMIRNRTETITQIGYAIGFNDQSYFTKCFKKRYGRTPTEFWVNPTPLIDPDEQES